MSAKALKNRFYANKPPEVPKAVETPTPNPIPESIPPADRPPSLGEHGDWAWDYLSKHAVGLTVADYFSMEVFCRYWAEFKRLACRLPDLDPEDLKDRVYEVIARRMVSIQKELSGLMDDFGLSPKARMRMFNVTNIRAGNAMASQATVEPEDEEPQRAFSDPVSKSKLDLYRPE